MKWCCLMRGFVCAAAMPGMFVPAAGAAAPEKLNVAGNRAMADNAILSAVRASGWRAGDGVARLRTLADAYYAEGYLSARFHIERDADSTWVLVIEEGEVARVGSMRIHGATAIRGDNVRRTLGLGGGEEFNPRQIDRRIAGLLRTYDDAGYPFVQVWVDSVGYDRARNVVDGVITVVEGQRRTIASVEVEGTVRTKPGVVARMSGLQVGSDYSARELDRAYLRLRASGVFDDVEYPTLRVPSDGHGVSAVLTVKEARQANSFAGALGYAAPESSDRRVISGLVRLRLNNIGGSLKDFDVLWNDDGARRRQTRIVYNDRFFLGRLMGFGVSLEQVGQDTLYTWQSAGLSFSRGAGRLGSVPLGISLGLNGDRNVFSAGPLLRSWRARGSVGVRIARGNRLAGGFASVLAKTTLARKRNTFRADSTATVRQTILEVEGEATIPLGSLVFARVAPVYRELFSAEDLVPLSEQFYVGGARTLRGYRENQFHGTRVLTMAAELLVGPGRWENGYLFVDVGYVRQPLAAADGRVSAESRRPVGFGFGFRTGSALGNIDLSFGMGDEISLQQTKVHVLLEQNF